jgi:excisionase family DNA binding protein
MSAPLSPITYTIADACRVSGLGKTKIYSMISEGRLQKVKVGKRTLVTAKSLNELLEMA